MIKFSAQYIITNSGPPLKRGIVTTDDSGTILSVEDTHGDLRESGSLEFHNGIIVPGFVNTHCHLELSHMKGTISPGEGLIGFINQVRSSRSAAGESIQKASGNADRDMYGAGVNLCADICNTEVTFSLKKKSRIKYVNLLEVFGIDPLKAPRRMEEIKRVSEIAAGEGLEFYLVPHSVYSVSLPLFRLLGKETVKNKVTSIHFMENPDEEELVERHSGAMMNSYIKSGLISSDPSTVKSHADAVVNEITRNGNLILVHNTFADRKTISEVRTRTNLFWCLCPGSNLYIENRVPPADLLRDEGCNITIGTDSLASNSKLDILAELKILQIHFPHLSIPELVLWATLNGAKALGKENEFGIIGEGKKPGLLLLSNVDLQSMKLLPESIVTRLT